MADDHDYENFWDLSDDPKLAEALGNLLVVWATAENQMVWVFAITCDLDVNRAHDAYYQIPTFDSRTKVLRSLLAHWKTKKHKPEAIARVIARLSRLSKTRNAWVHGAWMKRDDGKATIVTNYRAPRGIERSKVVKAADVRNHVEAVQAQIERLLELVPSDDARLDEDEP